MMNGKVEPIGTRMLPVWRCLHCGHEWVGKNIDPPSCCAGCKSPNWWKPKQEGIGRPPAKPSEPPAGPSESEPQKTD